MPAVGPSHFYSSKYKATWTELISINGAGQTWITSMNGTGQAWASRLGSPTGKCLGGHRAYAKTAHTPERGPRFEGSPQYSLELLGKGWQCLPGWPEAFRILCEHKYFWAGNRSHYGSAMGPSLSSWGSYSLPWMESLPRNQWRPRE